MTLSDAISLAGLLLVVVLLVHAARPEPVRAIYDRLAPPPVVAVTVEPEPAIEIEPHVEIELSPHAGFETVSNADGQTSIIDRMQ